MILNQYLILHLNINITKTKLINGKTKMKDHEEKKIGKNWITSHFLPIQAFYL